MATQRIKNIEIIQVPYQRTSNQMHNLQAKDKILQSSIMSLRDRIQNNRNQRNCKGCKIYQEEIAMIKNQQKQKVAQLQLTIRRLDDQNKVMAKNIKQLSLKGYSFIQKADIANPNGSSIGVQNLQKVVNQTKFLNNIDQTNKQLQYRQERQKQILNKLKRRKDRSIKNKSQVDIKDDPLASNYQNQILSSICQLQQKYQQLQQLKNKLEKDLQQKNRIKQQDSLRIINLLNEVDNYKQQIQNLDKSYQIKCRSIQQQKDNNIYQLSTKQKNLQNQIATLKSYIQSSNRIKQSLTQLKQTKQSQALALKKEKNQLQLMVRKIQDQLQFISKEKASKEQQITNLYQSLSKIQSNNFKIHKQRQQYRQLYEQSDQKYKSLNFQLNTIKEQNIKLASTIPNSKTKQSQEQIEYLRNMLNQSHLVISNGQDHINQLQSQLSSLKIQYKNIKDNFQNQFIALSKGQEQIRQRAEYITFLQRDRNQIIHILQNIAKQKEILQQHLNKQVESKSIFSQKYILQAEKNSQLYKKYSAIERQLDQYKKIKNKSQSLQSDKILINQLSNQLTSTKIVQQKLNQQSKNLKMAYETEQVQLNRLKSQLQMHITLKEVKEKEVQAKNKQIQQIIFFNNQMYQDIEHFRGENHFLINKIRELQHIILQIQQNYNRSIAQIQSFQRQKIALNESINSLINQNNAIKRQYSSQKQVLEQLVNSQKDEILMRKQDIKDRQKLIERQKQAVNVLTKINIQLQNRNHKDSQDKSHLQICIKELQDELVSLKKINESLTTKSNSSAKKPKDERMEDMTKLHDQLQQKTFKIIQLQNKLNQAQQQYEQLEVSYEKLNKKNQMLIQSQSRSTENIIYLNQKIQSLNKVYQASNGQTTEELVKELNKKKQMITQLLTNFKYVQKALNNKEAAYNQLVEKHQKFSKLTGRQKYELGEKLIAKQAQLNAIKRQKDQENKRFTVKLKQLEKLNTNLQDQLKLKERKQIEEKKQTQKQLVRIAQQKKKIQLTSCKEIMHLKETLQSQKKKSNQVSRNTSPARQQEPKKKQNDQSIKRNLDEKKKKIQELQEQLRNKEDQLQKLRTLNYEKDIEIQEMNDLLNQTEVHLDIKTHQVEKYQSKIQSYQPQIQKLKYQLALINPNHQLVIQNQDVSQTSQLNKQEELLIEGIQVSQQINQMDP